MNETQVVQLDAAEMDDYKKARQAGESVVEKSIEKPVEEEADAKVEVQADEGEHKYEKRKGNGGFQKRIDRLTKEKAELASRAEAAEKRAKEAEEKSGTPQKAAVQADPEPKQDDFKTHEEWIKAVARWEVRQELRDQEAAAEAAEEDARIKEIFDAHLEHVEFAREKYSDFDEKINATDTPWKSENPTRKDKEASQAFHIAITKANNGGEILYYYANHRDELDGLYGLEPNEIQGEVRIISGILQGTLARQKKQEETEEEEIEAEKPTKIASRAPAPIRPINQSATKSSVPLDKADMDVYKKARKAGRIH